MATTEIDRYTGSSGGPTRTQIDATTNRISTSDSATPGTGNPLPRPSGASTVLSYWVNVALYCTVAPATSINNLKVYTDGSMTNTGCTLKVGITNTYTQATGTTGSFGDASSVATTDAFTYTSASPLTVTSNATSGTGRLSYYIVFQLTITSSAVAGPSTAETMTLTYDEI